MERVPSEGDKKTIKVIIIFINSTIFIKFEEFFFVHGTLYLVAMIEFVSHKC